MKKFCQNKKKSRSSSDMLQIIIFSIEHVFSLSNLFFFSEIVRLAHWMLFWQPRRKTFSKRWEIFSHNSKCWIYYSFSNKHFIFNWFPGQVEARKVFPGFAKNDGISLIFQKKKHFYSEMSSRHVEYKIVNTYESFSPSWKNFAWITEKI